MFGRDFEKKKRNGFIEREKENKGEKRKQKTQNTKHTKKNIEI